MRIGTPLAPFLEIREPWSRRTNAQPERERIEYLTKKIQTKDEVRAELMAEHVDPAVTSGEDSSETGIVVAGLGENGHAYIGADLSGRLSPDGWAQRAVMAYQQHRADRLVGEANNGGDLIERMLRTLW